MTIKIHSKFHTLVSGYYLTLAMLSILQGNPDQVTKCPYYAKNSIPNALSVSAVIKATSYHIDSLQYHSFGLWTLPFLAMVPNVANLWGDTMSLLNPLNIIQQLILCVNSHTIQLPSH